jgi:hypothetical protein
MKNWGKEAKGQQTKKNRRAEGAGGLIEIW